MSRSIARALACLTLFTVASPARPQPPAPASSTPPGTGLVWRVERQGVVGFLVGSIHMLSPEYYPLPAPVEQAFSAAATVVGELHPDELTPAAATRMLSAALLPADRTLDRELPADMWERLRARVSNTPIPLAAFSRMKPWMAAITLVTLDLQRGGFQPELGVDRHLLERATSSGKRVEGLETLDAQTSRLNDLPHALQVDLVRETLADLESQADNIKHLADAWRAGDEATLTTLLVGELRKYPALYERLLVDRNRLWQPGLDACFTTHAPCLIVVGAAHLLGPDSVVASLRARGYTVERLQ